MNILLGGLLLINAAILVLLLLFALRFRAIYQQITDFITSTDAQTPSKLAVVVSTAADMIARSLVALLKTTFMGTKSAMVRGENAIDADFLEAKALDNPLLSIAMNAIPGLRRTLRRNPALIDLALSKLQPKAPVTTPENGHNPEGNQVKFNL